MFIGRPAMLWQAWPDGQKQGMTGFVMHVKCCLPRRHVPFVRSWKERRSRSFIQKTGAFLLWYVRLADFLSPLEAPPGFAGTYQERHFFFRLLTAFYALEDIPQSNGLLLQHCQICMDKPTVPPMFLQPPTNFSGTCQSHMEWLLWPPQTLRGHAHL